MSGKPSPEDIEDGIAAVAQALINIDAGLTTIEKGSRLFRGMELLMKPENAYAMKAAPEMLEVLQDLVAFHHPDSVKDQKKDARLRIDVERAWMQAEEAIAKATGEK